MLGGHMGGHGGAPCPDKGCLRPGQGAGDRGRPRQGLCHSSIARSQPFVCCGPHLAPEPRAGSGQLGPPESVWGIQTAGKCFPWAVSDPRCVPQLPEVPFLKRKNCL